VLADADSDENKDKTPDVSPSPEATVALVVPMAEQKPNSDENNQVQTTACAGQININTASAEDLDKITEVGPATAQKIILARPFYSLNDLLKVSGIGEQPCKK